MSAKELIDYCMRADLVDSRYVLKEVQALQTQLKKLTEAFKERGMELGGMRDRAESAEHNLERCKVVLEFYSGENYRVEVSKTAEEGGRLVIDDGELAASQLKQLNE